MSTDGPDRPEGEIPEDEALEDEALEDEALEDEALEDERGGFWQAVAPRRIDLRSALLVPLLAVIAALGIGAIVIAVTEGPGEILTAYGALGKGAFLGWRPFSETLTYATPVILAGLSVAIGFKAGLFNIGGEGQMIIGGFCAVVVGFSFEGLSPWLHVPLAVLAAIAGGAVWGGIPGWLRAKTGAHEVITTIMFNWIAIRLLDYLLKTSFVRKVGELRPISKEVLPSARLPRLLSWLPIDNAGQLRVHLGFILALVAAGFVWWLLAKTTIGFEFRSVGLNPDGARYAGMSVTRTTVAVMAVAGALAGLAGAGETLGTLGRASPGFSGGAGFDAIALALLGRSHPVGVVLAGLLWGALRAGSRTMDAQSAVGIDLIVVVQALIIVFIAAPALVRAIFRVRTGEGVRQLTRGWGA
jgi:ABC-type uncharacterized transport system permease subunit